MVLRTAIACNQLLRGLDSDRLLFQKNSNELMSTKFLDIPLKTNLFCPDNYYDATFYVYPDR
ncbi:MAG: hypothetical protein VKL59_02750 [Nostocaceae cyanobacterium]|nr:hypothetical protein [Nostocaceae cyanobacterium]